MVDHILLHNIDHKTSFNYPKNSCFATQKYSSCMFICLKNHRFCQLSLLYMCIFWVGLYFFHWMYEIAGDAINLNSSHPSTLYSFLRLIC